MGDVRPLQNVIVELKSLPEAGIRDVLSGLIIFKAMCFHFKETNIFGISQENLGFLFVLKLRSIAYFCWQTILQIYNN